MFVLVRVCALDDMLAATANDLIDDDEPPISLVGLDLASRQRRGREREPEPEEVVEARAFELLELSVLPLRQLVARLGGAGLRRRPWQRHVRGEVHTRVRADAR